MQPFRKETCGSGHVYPLALVSGSSGVRGQGALEASAGKSGVECSEAKDIHMHTDTCTYLHGNNCHDECESIIMLPEQWIYLLCNDRHETMIDTQSLAFMLT